LFAEAEIMKNAFRNIAMLAVVLSTSVALSRGTIGTSADRAARIIETWHDADDPTVLVVAHRGAWHHAPENSLPAIEAAIGLGCDMVEIDVRRTSDGVMVLMHDTTLERTTTGRGEIDQMSFAEVRRLRLLAADGSPTELRVPTLEEAFATCRGRIMVNVDKAGSFLDEVLQLATRKGMIDHVVVKSRVRPGDIPGALQRLRVNEKGPETIDPAIAFMPIVVFHTESDDSVFETLSQYGQTNVMPVPPAVEVVMRGRTTGDRLAPMLRETSSLGYRLWLNSLWDDISGGRSDAEALQHPEEVWGWMIDVGATVIQTDEPGALLDYLRRRGRRW
jgi:glycerophosphoryl diester phosphodiesterase